MASEGKQRHMVVMINKLTWLVQFGSCAGIGVAIPFCGAHCPDIGTRQPEEACLGQRRGGELATTAAHGDGDGDDCACNVGH